MIPRLQQFSSKLNVEKLNIIQYVLFNSKTCVLKFFEMIKVGRVDTMLRVGTMLKVGKMLRVGKI